MSDQDKDNRPIIEILDEAIKAKLPHCFVDDIQEQAQGEPS